ncbi:MAG: 2'-5' RNA ligase family protein, partial [Saprospiraceae bacterium]|nr:2'-5' RNA ligase family protein [Saprospiraceae bacterium]
PHLTLIPPFTWPEMRFDVLADCLHGFTRQHPIPTVRLLNFSSFPPRVIFVNVEPDPELQQFQQSLENHLEEQLNIRTDRQYGFHPHVTVAFKDLRESVFPQAWAYFSAQTFAHTFQPPGMALLRHNGQYWEVNREFGV